MSIAFQRILSSEQTNYFSLSLIPLYKIKIMPLFVRTSLVHAPVFTSIDIIYGTVSSHTETNGATWPLNKDHTFISSLRTHHNQEHQTDTATVCEFRFPYRQDHAE